MDDVDAVQSQIARNMLDSGDWVTAHQALAGASSLHTLGESGGKFLFVNR